MYSGLTSERVSTGSFIESAMDDPIGVFWEGKRKIVFLGYLTVVFMSLLSGVYLATALSSPIVLPRMGMIARLLSFFIWIECFRGQCGWKLDCSDPYIVGGTLTLMFILIGDVVLSLSLQYFPIAHASLLLICSLNAFMFTGCYYSTASISRNTISRSTFETIGLIVSYSASFWCLSVSYPSLEEHEYEIFFTWVRMDIFISVFLHLCMVLVTRCSSDQYLCLCDGVYSLIPIELFTAFAVCLVTMQAPVSAFVFLMSSLVGMYRSYTRMIYHCSPTRGAQKTNLRKDFLIVEPQTKY